MGLCWDHKLRGEEAAVVEASLVALQIGIDRVLEMALYYGPPAAAGMGTERVLDRRRDIERMAQVTARVHGAGTTEQAKQLASGLDAVGKIVLGMLRAHSVGSLRVVPVKLRAHIVGNLMAAPGTLPANIVGSLRAVPVIQPCTDHGIVLVAQGMVLSRIDTAALVAPARLPCSVPEDV